MENYLYIELFKPFCIIPTQVLTISFTFNLIVVQLYLVFVGARNALSLSLSNMCRAFGRHAVDTYEPKYFSVITIVLIFFSKWVTKTLPTTDILIHGMRKQLTR